MIMHILGYLGEASQLIANMLSLMEVNNLADLLMRIWIIAFIICDNAGSVTRKKLLLFQSRHFCVILNC